MGQKPTMHEYIYTEDTIDEIAYKLYTYTAHASVFTFQGSLGAGKTTLIQAILSQAGVSEPAPSPTYTYMHTYTTPHGETIYHFDLYRLPDQEAFFEAGFDEYLYAPQTWSFIEWPGIVMDLLTHDVCHFYISHYGRDRRRLRYICVPSENTCT